MPLHEQTEVGLEEFQVLMAELGNSKPCLRAISAWKSEMREEEETEVFMSDSKSVAAKTMKGTIFCWRCFMESELGRK